MSGDTRPVIDCFVTPAQVWAGLSCDQRTQVIAARAHLAPHEPSAHGKVCTMSELRLNIVTGEWVVVATERARRPDQFVLPAHAAEETAPPSRRAARSARATKSWSWNACACRPRATGRCAPCATSTQRYGRTAIRCCRSMGEVRDAGRGLS